MMEKGRARWGVFPQADGIERCINGHEYTPENTSFQAGGKRRRCRICYRARNRIFRLSHNDRHNELARKYRQQKRDRLVCQE
jgi:hypothetical protein